MVQKGCIPYIIWYSLCDILIYPKLNDPNPGSHELWEIDSNGRWFCDIACPLHFSFLLRHTVLLWTSEKQCSDAGTSDEINARASVRTIENWLPDATSSQNIKKPCHRLHRNHLRTMDGDIKGALALVKTRLWFGVQIPALNLMAGDSFDMWEWHDKENVISENMWKYSSRNSRDSWPCDWGYPSTSTQRAL